MAAIEKVFRNGRIYTCEPGQPWATAIAVTGDRLVAVGDEAAADGWANDTTDIIDLGGAFVMPGFIDAHNHYGMQGQTEVFERPVDPNLDLAGLLDQVRAAVADLPDGDWAVVSPYSAAVQAEVETEEALRKLDEASGGHPVIVREYSRHNRWVNSAALAAAGIGLDTPNPDHGVIVKDPRTGQLTGVLYETAGLPVEHAYLEAKGYGTDEFARSVRRGLEILNSYGITAMADAAASADIMRGAKLLDDAGEMSAWVVSAMPANDQIFGFDPIGSPLFDIGLQCRTEHHRPDFLKIWLDGIPPARTAAFSQPYLPQPGDEPGFQTCGETLLTEDDLYAVLADGAERGLSAIIHCTGDASIHAALNVFERLRGAGYSEPSYHLSHCQYILPSDRPRIAALNVVAEASPFFWVPGPVPAAICGMVPAEISEDIHPNRDLLDQGVALVAGSDWPCSDTPDPWYAIHGLVTRTDPVGITPGTLNADQAVSLTEAIAMCTSSAAASLGLSDDTGSLAPGKSADFIVLDRNPFEIDPTELSRMTVLQTWFGARQVYQAA